MIYIGLSHGMSSIQINQAQHHISLCETIQKDHLCGIMHNFMFQMLVVQPSISVVMKIARKFVMHVMQIISNCGNHHVGVVDFSFCKNGIQVVLCPSSKNYQTCAYKLLSKIAICGMSNSNTKMFLGNGWGQSLICERLKSN